MKKNKNLSLHGILVLAVVLTTFSVISVEARKNHSKKGKTHKHQKQRNSHRAPTPDYGNSSNIFNVFNFGAKGDGVSDDSKVMYEYQYIVPHL